MKLIEKIQQVLGAIAKKLNLYKLVKSIINCTKPHPLAGCFKGRIQNRGENEIIINIDRQFSMPVPDEVIFGVDDETLESITYGKVRTIKDENKLYFCFLC